MNYGDLLKFVKYNRFNDKTSAGDMLSTLIDSTTTTKGEKPYIYLDQHNNVRIASVTDNFAPTKAMSEGHRNLQKNLIGEDSDYWMDRTINALGANKKIIIDKKGGSVTKNKALDELDKWNKQGKPELVSEAVDKVLSIKYGNSKKSAEDFYFNNKRFKRTETNEKGNTLTKFYNDDGDVIRQTVKNRNGNVVTIDDNHNFVEKIYNKDTGGYTVNYGAFENDKKIIKSTKQINKNEKVSSSNVKTAPSISDLKKGYSFVDENGVKWTISNINEPDPKLGINKRGYNIISGNGGVGSEHGERGAQRILGFDRVEDVAVEDIDAFERLKNLGADIEMHERHTLESRADNSKEGVELNKEKLNNSIDEYLKLEKQVQEAFPDYERGREDEIIKHYRPDQANTEQIIADTSEQYDTEQPQPEPQVEEKPTASEDTKTESGPKMDVESGDEIVEAFDESIPGGIDFDAYGDNTFSPPEDTNMPTTSEEMIQYAKEQREKNLEKPQYNQNSEPKYYSNAKADQEKIDRIWNNLDPNMTIDEFMDQFAGIDGVTQRDIDRQKVRNRGKQNKNSGMSEQESIDDIWNYITQNNIDATIEDVEKAFSDIVEPINVDQEKIDKIWNNLDPNMSIEDFMDQFAGIDGVSQRDIDIQKVKNRIKHNKEEGMSEQETISDLWDYINSNKLDVGTEDISNIFSEDLGIEKLIPVKPKNPVPKFEDETIDMVNKNNKNKQSDKNKQITKQKNKNKQPTKKDDKTKQKTVTQQIKDTYKEIQQVLAKNRRNKNKRAYDLIRRGKYEEINVRTTMGKVQAIRNRRNGEIVQRTFISTGKDQIEYQMGHGKHGRIDYEVYRDADSGILNYLRHYKDKWGPIPKRETGNHIPNAVENPITGEKTITKKAEEAFAEAGEIVKNLKGDQWTEMDAETFNFDVEKERDKFRNPEDGEWVPEKYTKEEREFLENREQKFKDELDIAEEEWQGFKENNKGLERKIKNKIDKLEKQLNDPNISTAEKDKIRKKLADYTDRLDNYQNERKALKDRRKKAKQDWNNRNTEGKINQELKNLSDLPENINVDKFYEQYEKLKNTNIEKLSAKEKYKYEEQLKRADILKKKIEKRTIEESSLEKLKKNVLKSKRNIENMSPSQFIKEIGISGIMSGITAVSTYKDNRREGKSVLSSAVRAGADFVLSETLGPGAYMALNLIKEAPDLAVKGASALFRETRRLNSSARFATFGEANFQDSQQLATMRQSGMELAKMSQYRLEQTLMGNEAKYLHR